MSNPMLRTLIIVNPPPSPHPLEGGGEVNVDGSSQEGASPSPSTQTTRDNSPTPSPREGFDFILEDVTVLPMLDNAPAGGKSKHSALLSTKGRQWDLLQDVNTPPSGSEAVSGGTSGTQHRVRRFSEVHEAVGLDSLVNKLRDGGDSNRHETLN